MESQATVAPILYEEDLLKASGYTRRADLERHLKDSRIPYQRGKGGRIWTTVLATLQPQGHDRPPTETEF